MANEISSLGKPYLEYPTAVLANFIVNSFSSANGKDIPIKTVATLLSPGKSDKRPNIDKKVKVKRA